MTINKGIKVTLLRIWAWPQPACVPCLRA